MAKLLTLSVSASRARQIRPIIVDPGLYLSSRNDIFYATQKRDLPNAYKLFTGEGVLSCIMLEQYRIKLLMMPAVKWCTVGPGYWRKSVIIHWPGGFVWYNGPLKKKQCVSVVDACYKVIKVEHMLSWTCKI